MTHAELRRRLIGQLRSTCSMEEAAGSALDLLADRTPDEQLSQLVREHQRNSARHRERLLARLRALDPSSPPGRRIGASIVAAAGGLYPARRSRTDFELLHDALLVKQLGVAAYDIMERLAQRAGDRATARVAREARQDEERLAQVLAVRRSLDERSG